MMGTFIAKQPNGLYCRFSSIVDCPTDWNMTKEDYIEMCVEEASEKARKEAERILYKHVYDFQKVIDRFVPNNMTEEEFEQFVKDASEN